MLLSAINGFFRAHCLIPRLTPTSWRPSDTCAGSGATSLLLGLAGNGTAAAGGAGVDDNIVFGIFGHNSRIAQVKAGRAWRKVWALKLPASMATTINTL